MKHRWAFDDEPLSGEQYGYCLNHCDVTWPDGDPEPTEPCPGDQRPTLTRFVTQIVPPARYEPNVETPLAEDATS